MFKVCHRYILRTPMMTIMISIGILCTLTISLTHGQTSSVFNRPATGASLGAVVQPSPSPVHNGVSTNITITFLTLRFGISRIVDSLPITHAHSCLVKQFCAERFIICIDLVNFSLNK